MHYTVVVAIPIPPSDFVWPMVCHICCVWDLGSGICFFLFFWGMHAQKTFFCLRGDRFSSIRYHEIIYFLQCQLYEHTIA